MVLVIMGVAGSGKTTVGKLLAQTLGWEFRDGDDFHPSANVAKMKSGVPLEDSDRRPWLAAIRSFMDESHTKGKSVVIACSALRQDYRKILGGDLESVHFVFLHGSRKLIEARMRARNNHFMPPGLLDSQFAALESPADALPVDVKEPPRSIVANIIEGLGLDPLADVR